MSSPPPPNPYTPTPISNPKMRRPHPPPTSGSGSGSHSAPSPPSSISQQQPQQPHPKKPRMHPLRQTSFPASEDSDPRVFSATSTTGGAARSDIDTGSVTGSFTGSLDGIIGLGGAGGVGKKKGKGTGRTGRPRKNRDKDGTPGGSARGSVVDGEKEGDGDGGSSVRGGAGGGGGDGASRVDGEEEEEDEDEDVLFGGEEGPTDTEAEKKNLAILIDAFDPTQSLRYNLFKRSKLRKESVRKIVNQVLSQSVPPSVVTTVNGYTKLFIGEIVERARVVQGQWADAYDQLAIEIAEAEAAEAKAAEEEAAASADTGADASSAVEKKDIISDGTFLSGINEAAQTHTIPGPDGTTSFNPQTPNATTTQSNNNSMTDGWKKPFKLPPNPHRGQLLPTHIREAYRRYKVDGEGGGVGYSGLSLKALGTKGAASCSIGGVGGRRLFR